MIKKNFYKFCCVWMWILLLPLFCNGSDVQKKLLMEKGAVLLDVRSVQEYRAGHLRSAVNLPLDRLGKEIQTLVKDPGTPLYLYCRSGRRSAEGLKVLQKMKYKKLYDLGGMKAAQKKLEFPVVK